MFRLAVPLLVTAVASIDDDSVSLMQGMKPKEQKEDKSKAIANLMQSATNMLKNGATPDVVSFASATLDEIDRTVLEAITDAHATDQSLVTSTFAAFQNAITELSEGNAEIAADYATERDLSTRHKACRGQEQTTCQDKRDCDYALWAIWQRFVEEEGEMRGHSTAISNHFCPPDGTIANGTTWDFRDHAVSSFTPWLEQKPIVEHWEQEYDDKVPQCEGHFNVLDDKTAECDALQTQLEEAACTHANKVQEVRNTFSESWNFAVVEYQRVANEVHCLEIDRWNEWKTLKTVECLLARTTERNGRPCDEATQEIQVEITHCEEVRSTEDVSALVINYPVPPALPTLPAVPHACTATNPGAYTAQEYGDLWIEPTPTFNEENSHCNQRPECEVCSVVAEVASLTALAANPPQVQIPTVQDECVPAQGGQHD